MTEKKVIRIFGNEIKIFMKVLVKEATKEMKYFGRNVQS